MELKWKDIYSLDDGPWNINTAASKVYGGWLIAHTVAMRDNVSTSLVFVPDEDVENHQFEEV